jgi:hypothetical protein
MTMRGCLLSRHCGEASRSEYFTFFAASLCGTLYLNTGSRMYACLVLRK